MNTEEARKMAEGKPLSFLRVTRSEIEFPPGADPYSDEVYQHGARNLRKMIQDGVLVQSREPEYMIYRLKMGDHEQTGLVAAASCREYDEGTVRKHELTRPDKEDDRTRHINILAAQTGPVFLTYRSMHEIDEMLSKEAERSPDVEFTAEDGIKHSAWFISDAVSIAAIQSAFEKVPVLYVADGHHRSAAASRVARERSAADQYSANKPYNYFLTVTFPHNQMQILGYNRVVRDLNGLAPEQLLAQLSQFAKVEPLPAPGSPSHKGELTMYLAGHWYRLRWKPDVIPTSDPVGALDVSILQDKVLGPLLAIGDPRTDKRISFVGGIRGNGELERLVNDGSNAVAFALFPTAIEDLMEIADQNGLMPPKSTWFEPKLRDGMAVHLINE